MTAGKPAYELLLTNVRLPGLVGLSAIGMAGGRIVALGAEGEVGRNAGEIVDGEGGLALPGFHDAHLHLLSWARSLTAVNCSGLSSIAGIRQALARRERSLPAGAWLQAVHYDDARLTEGRHPDRHDLDAVSRGRPIRLRHRGLHLDVLNTAALHELRLLDESALERDQAGEPTGRLFHGGQLIARRRRRGGLRPSLAQASERLLALGVTSVQDASPTNGPEQLALFERASASGELRPRLFAMTGQAYQGPSVLVRRTQVKLIIDEGRTPAAELREAACEARAAGASLALHASTEAELVLALAALEAAGPPRGPLPDRIEHGCVIPMALLPRLRRLGAAVVGNPAWLAERERVYAEAHPPELHGWLHRARSLLMAGIPYAAGSDAPVAEPNPLLAFHALRRRRLSREERLSADQALAALTRWPAEAAGLGHELGLLAPGFLADVAVLDRKPDTWRPRQPSPVRLSIVAGQVAWRP